MRDNIISVFGAALNQQLVPVSKDITFQSTKTQKTVRWEDSIPAQQRQIAYYNIRYVYQFVWVYLQAYEEHGEKQWQQAIRVCE